MSSKKPMKQKTANSKEDLVIYKILIAIVAACVALIAIYQVNAHYGYVAYTMNIYRGVLIASIVFAVLAVAFLVAAALVRQKKGLCSGLLVGALLSAMFAFTSLLFRVYVFEAAPILYAFWIAATILYAIYLLYQPEFFLISLLTAASGFLFFYAFQSYADGMSTTMMLAVAVVMALAIVICILTALAARKDGKLSIGSHSVQIFVGRSPMLLYLTCALWALCTICVLLLGATFAYYCLFAAIAYELIAACYYTMKLR